MAVLYEKQGNGIVWLVHHEGYETAHLRSVKAIEKNRVESRREWMLWMFRRAGLQNGNNSNFQLWRQDNQPIELDSLTKQHSTLEYIHNNPVEAGIVEKSEDYLYSSARDYYGFTGKIAINKLDAMTI